MYVHPVLYHALTQVFNINNIIIVIIFLESGKFTDMELYIQDLITMHGS